MNRFYRLVFSALQGDVVAAGENARHRAGALGSGSGSGPGLGAGPSVERFFAYAGAMLIALLAFVLLSTLIAPAGLALATVGTGVNKRVKYKVEGSWGTIPAAGSAQLLRRVSSEGNLKKGTFESAEIVSHMQRVDYRHGVRAADYVLKGELSPGTYKDFVAAGLRRAYTAVTAITALSITISGTGPTFTIARGAGSWLTDGLKVGQVGRLTAGAFNAANLNKNLVVVSLTASNAVVIPLNGVALVAEGPIGSATWTPTGKVTYAPTSGHTDLSYSIEDWHSDLSLSEVFNGQKVNRIPVRVPAEGMCGIDFEFMGKDITAAGAEYFTSPTAETSTGICDGAGAVVIVQGAVITTVTGANFTVDGNMSAENVVGSTTRQDIAEGRVLAEGQLGVLFDAATFRDYFLNETEVSVSIILPVSPAAAADFMGFTFPRVKFGGADKDDGDKSLIRTLPFTALYNAAGGAGTSSEQTTVYVQDSQA